MPDMDYFTIIAKEAALEAGLAVMSIYTRGWFGEELKKDASPLTDADKQAHAIISAMLAKTGLPVQSEEGKVISYHERKDWQHYWLIDPLDGTREFISRNGEFTINIALMQGSMPVAGVIYAPCSDTLYTGSKETGVNKNEKGMMVHLPGRAQKKTFAELCLQQHLTAVVSRSHLSAETGDFLKKFPAVTILYKGSSLKFMMLAENLVDIYPRFGTTMEWDTAAAHAILNACNHGIYEVNGEEELVYNKRDQTNPHFLAF